MLVLVPNMTLVVAAIMFATTMSFVVSCNI
jgi:hypothetical protein